MPAQTETSSPNLQRGLEILEYLAANQRSDSIAELTERLGYPSASVFRVTRVLHEMGYLARDTASKRYSLTNKLLSLGQPQGSQLGLVESALPALRGLVKQTGETSQICCLADVNAVVIEQLISTHPFKYSSNIGAMAPVHSCAPGKAMVAALPTEQRDELLSRLKLKRFTKTTITNRTAFRKELSEIGERGYSLDRGEGMEGIRCVAAAIVDRHGLPVGSLTIAGPAARLPEANSKRLGQMLIEAATAASERYQG